MNIILFFSIHLFSLPIFSQPSGKNRKGKKKRNQIGFYFLHTFLSPCRITRLMLEGFPFETRRVRMKEQIKVFSFGVKKHLQKEILLNCFNQKISVSNTLFIFFWTVFSILQSNSFLKRKGGYNIPIPRKKKKKKVKILWGWLHNLQQGTCLQQGH
jgi:hypothetical protein